MNFDQIPRPYPGRLELIGRHPDPESDIFILAHVLTGRSEGSKGRRMEKNGERGVRVVAIDPSKMSPADQRILLYDAMAFLDLGERWAVVSNGGQTEVITARLDPMIDLSQSTGEMLDRCMRASYMVDGIDMCTFEPEFTKWTPRTSGLVGLEQGSYALQIIRRWPDGERDIQTESYVPMPGLGHIISTYDGPHDFSDFVGDPREVDLEGIPGTAQGFADEFYDKLHPAYRVSVAVAYLHPENPPDVGIVNTL